MAPKSNAKRKGPHAESKAKEKKTTPYDDIESLQVTFYEIESWIEKTTPILTRMTKELEKASGHFEKKRKESPSKVIVNDQQVVDPKNLEQQLLQFQQQQQPWKRNTMISDSETPSPSLPSSSTLTENNDTNSMQWLLSFQPGNLLRLDTNITSVEQLIQAVQKIRLIQSEEPSTSASTTTTTLVEEEDMALELLYSSPSSSSNDIPQDASSVEYWQYAIGRRPKICLENYKHCRMNLNGLTKNISPTALNYIGQVFWDCLHPKFSSNWNSFWDRSAKT